jgi:mono/diheme cytochrome c family protein
MHLPDDRPKRGLRLLGSGAVGVGLIVLLVAASFAVFSLSRWAGAAEPQGDVSKAAAPKLDFQRELTPFFQQYCYDCHTGDSAMKGLALEKFTTEAAVTGHRPQFTKILKMLRGGLMPPPDQKDRPPKEEVDRVVAWLDWKLHYVDCNLARDPGRVTIRRLNRAEYRNTIRDLLGVDFQGTKDFPADDVGYGFDNIGDVLSLPPILMERYLEAAEEIVAKAIVSNPAAQNTTKRYAAAETKGGEARDAWRGLASVGDVWVEHNFPAVGEYTLRVQAYGDQAGDEPAKMEFKIDRRSIGVSPVKAVRREPGVYEQKAKVAAGRHRFSVTFTNDYYRPNDPNPRNRDRNLHVGFMELVAPPGVKATLPESHTRLIMATPGATRTWDESAREVLGKFARRAYRRPVTDAEVDRLLQLARMARSKGETFEGSIALAVQAVLVSPNFLFRIELDPEPSSQNAVRTLNEHELAVRLSYFLWSSMPDAELFGHAERGTLRQNLVAQVRRMVRDRKADALVENFVGQWLQLRNLYSSSPDPRRFPSWNSQLLEAARKETEMYFAGVLREDRNIFEFVDSDYTFLNERLAKHYGISGVQGDEFRRVSLVGRSGTPSDAAAARQRGGVLTQASVLRVTSSPTRTSPVKRGKWILEQILGTEPPPPPANVEQLADGRRASGTLRQRLEQHRSKPSCAVCHQHMDPLGFAFENYDAIGAWRDKERDSPIDASAELPDGRKFSGPAELKKILLSDDAKFRRCLAEKMLTYALGRGLEYYDKCAVDDICNELKAGGDRFQTMVLAIVKSEPFQKRRGKRAE